MGIKYLDQYLAERKHVQTLPLSTLGDTRLGIDASHYLSQLLSTSPTREPLLAATGGLPLALTSRIESDLRTLEKYRVKPVFVFPGLLPNKAPKEPQGNPSRKNSGGIPPGAGLNMAAVNEGCRERKEAWDAYERGKTDVATRIFEGRSEVPQWDLWRSILRIFRHRSVEFIVAPYLAWSQLIYLQRHQKSYAHAIFGPTDTLLYPFVPSIDKLIVSIDFTASTPTFSYISKRHLLNELQLTDDQFLDVGLLSGFEHSITFPLINMPESTFKTAVDMVKYYKTGFQAVSAFADHPGVKQLHYTDHFARTRSLIKFSLILSSEGSVVPLSLALPTTHHMTAADVPSDLHEIFTHRLPDEIYFYLSRGLIGPQALVWITSGQILENPPLDNGEITEYRRFIKEVITEGATGPRATALGLISSVSHNFWASKKVYPHFWFENPNLSKGVVHNGAGTAQLVERVSGWSVPCSYVEEELRRQSSSTIDFALCLGATSTDKLALRTRGKVSAERPLEKKDEVVANVIWRFLELRGFLLHTHNHSPLAKAMHYAIKQTRVNDKFQDPLYLFLELVRAGVMHGNQWTGRAYSGGPSFGLDEEKKSMLLIMRVLSIVPLNFKPQTWTGPLSRELLVFNSFLRSLSRALRTLIELTSLNMLLHGHARRARDDLLDIALSLPFQTDVNTGFGILAKVYLDALVAMNGGKVTDKDAEGVADAKDGALEICDETFEGIKYPRSEVERGFRFWDAALVAIRVLRTDNSVMPDLADAFENAQAWLAPMRP